LNFLLEKEGRMTHLVPVPLVAQPYQQHERR
jgi:hypothetical protein